MDFLPAVSGLLMEQELEYPGRATDNPARPYAAILGEPKVSEKIAVIENLLTRCDTVIIGGGNRVYKVRFPARCSARRSDARQCKILICQDQSDADRAKRARTRIPSLQSQPPVNPARRSPAITAGQPRMMSQMRPDR